MARQSPLALPLNPIASSTELRPPGWSTRNGLPRSLHPRAYAVTQLFAVTTLASCGRTSGIDSYWIRVGRLRHLVLFSILRKKQSQAQPQVSEQPKKSTTMPVKGPATIASRKAASVPSVAPKSALRREMTHSFCNWNTNSYQH
jgi:hypothetical protein